ncbi:hypothetical protein BU15DRAFT_52337 [Melanogaster broomeanus]|nr:hypothetical protein BU15DRAFT_52337 [Melanogaster broomeanus]
MDEVKVYSDGSGQDGRIGAAAVLYREGKAPQILRFHLGSADDHTVYEAEAVGLTLAAKLIATEPNMPFPVSIFVDNQATIKSGEIFTTKPGHYILDKLRRMLAKIQNDHSRGKEDIVLRWISGHEGVIGNERADEEAKEAAKSPRNTSARMKLPLYLRNGTLLSSLSALKQAQKSQSAKRWAREWSLSPRHALATKYGADQPSNTFVKNVAHLTKRHISLLIWLRTGHVSLNQHLHRIKKMDTPNCPNCEDDRQEMIEHFLLMCPHYARERHALQTSLGRVAFSLPFILARPEASKHVIRFINDTKRLSDTFGNVTPSRPNDR